MIVSITLLIGIEVVYQIFPRKLIPFLYHSFLKHELAQPFISLNNLLFYHKSKHSENMTITLLSHNKIYMAENKIVQDVKFLIKIVDFNKARHFFPLHLKGQTSSFIVGIKWARR